MLYAGIFRMSAGTTPAVAEVLAAHGLESLPEAHCYLRYQGTVLDYTAPGWEEARIAEELIKEIALDPADTADLKIQTHKRFISAWLEANPGINFSAEEVWTIRERCIEALSHPSIPIQ